MRRKRSSLLVAPWILAAVWLGLCGGGERSVAAPPAGADATDAVRAVELPEGLDPARWPGKIPAEAGKPLAAMVKQLALAQNEKDAGKIKAIVREMRKVLGRYAGAPEVQPEYAAPIETGPVDLGRAESLWRKVFEKHQGRNGWELSMKDRAAGRCQQRLRVSFRTAVSDLRCFDAGLDRAAEYRDVGLAGFNYILSQQTSVGMFGYPYNPQPTGRVQAYMLALVREGEKRGLKMREGVWCIDDLTEGGLQFDNGEAGAGLLYAYAITGERRFLDAARRAADWAIGRQLVANWNYNSFSGFLLARLYRVTGEKKYLDAAKDKFEFGVLPGQMENGRWFDQHNASPQYHAIMARNLVEYTLALEQAQDPCADETRRRTKLALDSVAEETTRFGPSNVAEGLSLESLAIGLIALGPNARWERAAHVYANYLVNHLLPQLLQAGKTSGPETLPAYILWRKVRQRHARSHEVSIGK